MQPLQGLLTERYGFEHCPDNPSAAIKECGDSVRFNQGLMRKIC